MIPVKKRLRMGAWVSAFVATLAGSALAQAPAGLSAQRMLDFLARPAVEFGGNLKIADLPNHYSDWTEAQKRQGLQQMVSRCGLVIALEHDNPAVRMLPASMTRLEESQLSMSVCLAAKMPVDWPGRTKSLEDAQRLIVKARSLGSTLQLPEGVGANGWSQH